MVNKTSSFFIILVLTLWLCTCATIPTPIAYQCPHITLPPDPIPATTKLTSQSKPDQVVKAWVATTIAYKGWNTIVRQQVAKSN